MKYKKDKLYRVAKGIDSDCKGCVFRYKGTDIDGTHYGRPIKLGKRCRDSGNSGCLFEFQRAIDYPDRHKMVEYEGMVKFCKKLRKERKNETRSNS